MSSSPLTGSQTSDLPETNFQTQAHSKTCLYCTFIFAKLQKHMYSYISLQFPGEITTSGSKTLTTCIHFKQIMIAVNFTTVHYL